MKVFLFIIFSSIASCAGLLKEALTLGLYQVKKLYGEQSSGNTSMQLIKSGFDYLTQASMGHGVQIPLFNFTILSFASDLYIELGKPEKQIALVLDTVLLR